MKEQIFVKDVMTKRDDIVAIEEGLSVKDLFKKYKKHYYHSFPVLKDDRLVGVIKEDVVLIRLLYEYLEPRAFSKTVGRAEISNIERYISEDIQRLSSPLIAIRPQAKIEEAAALMIRNGVSRLVVTEDDTLVGIISKRDIIRKLISRG